MNNPAGQNIKPHIEDLGYPADVNTHLSDQEADEIIHTEAADKVHNFIRALNMQNPVSYEVAVAFLRAVGKDTLPTHAEVMAMQMRAHDWEQHMQGDDKLEEVAKTAFAYLQSDEGIELGNFFSSIVARTNAYMFKDDEQTRSTRS